MYKQQLKTRHKYIIPSLQYTNKIVIFPYTGLK